MQTSLIRVHLQIRTIVSRMDRQSSGARAGLNDAGDPAESSNMGTRRHEYTIDIKRGFIYRKGRGPAVAQIVPQEDRGKDKEFKAVKRFIARAIIALQEYELNNQIVTSR